MFWNDLDRWNAVWQDLAGYPGSIANTPALNLYANQEKAVVQLAIPGVKSDSLDISLESDVLTVKGERASDKADTKDSVETTGKSLRQERTVGKFKRIIQLPFRVENSAVKAEYKNGILSVELPRASSDLPKKIQLSLAHAN